MKYVIELHVEADRVLSDEELAEGRAVLLSDFPLQGGGTGRVVDLVLKVPEPEDAT